MSETPEIGSIVRLKSGGPPMTVVADLGGGRVQCRWFSGSVPHRGPFPVAALAPVETETGPTGGGQ